MAKKQTGKTRQPRSKVKFSAPAEISLSGRTEWKFKSYYDDELVGELIMTRGSVTWRFKRQGKDHAVNLDWRKFDKIMREYDG